MRRKTWKLIAGLIFYFFNKLRIPFEKTTKTTAEKNTARKKSKVLNKWTCLSCLNSLLWNRCDVLFREDIKHEWERKLFALKQTECRLHNLQDFIVFGCFKKAPKRMRASESANKNNEFITDFIDNFIIPKSVNILFQQNSSRKFICLLPDHTTATFADKMAN